MKNKKLTFNDCWYPEDVKRLSKVCIENGLFVSPYDLQEAWEDSSSHHYSSWLSLNSLNDEELFQELKDFL